MKERKSNIELCRIIAIMLVVMVHATYGSLGWPKNLSDTTFLTIFSESISIVGVNVFVIITGWFTVKLKKKSIINLLYICLFYGVLEIICEIFNDSFSYKSLLIISQSNWFIMAYIGLLAFSPVLNSFITSVDKTNYKRTLIILFIIQTWFGFLPGYCRSFCKGYSIISFVILYLASQYFHKYGYPNILKKYSLSVYFISSIIIALIGWYILKLPCLNNELFSIIFAYSNPFIILGAFSLFFTFERMYIKKNKYINYTAQSCLAVLLIHTNSFCFPYMQKYFKMNYQNESFFHILILGFIGILIIFLLSVIIDQIRIFTYRILLKIKLLN